MLKQNSYDPVQTSRSPTAHMNLGRGGCVSAHLLELVNSTEDRGNIQPGCYFKTPTSFDVYVQSITRRRECRTGIPRVNDAELTAHSTDHMGCDQVMDN